MRPRGRTFAWPDRGSCTVSKPQKKHADPKAEPAPGRQAPDTKGRKRPAEIGGRDGPEPTRYGDWEKNGRAVDF